MIIPPLKNMLRIVYATLFLSMMLLWYGWSMRPHGPPARAGKWDDYADAFMDTGAVLAVAVWLGTMVLAALWDATGRQFGMLMACFLLAIFLFFFYGLY